MPNPKAFKCLRKGSCESESWWHISCLWESHSLRRVYIDDSCLPNGTHRALLAISLLQCESTARGSHSGSWPSLFLKSPNIYVFFLGERKPGEIAWKTIYQEELNEMTHQSPADGEDSSVVKHWGWGQLCAPDLCQHSWVTAGVWGRAHIDTHGFAGQKHLLCR